MSETILNSVDHSFCQSFFSFHGLIAVEYIVISVYSCQATGTVRNPASQTCLKGVTEGTPIQKAIWLQGYV